MEAPASTADWLAQNPPSDGAFAQSLAGVAERSLAGESFDLCAREFLDEFALLPDDALRSRALQERPRLTGRRHQDAYLGALAEHLAATSDLDRPGWSVEPERFSDRFWFKSDVPGFRALAIAQSPAAFRRRGLFIARGALERC